MNSSVYQLASEANATNQSDNIYYSKYIVRRLSAEVILDAMSQVTGAPTAFAGYPAGTRALQLPDTQVKSDFLASFGRPPRIMCDAAERSSRPHHRAGARRDQRRHAQQEVERARRHHRARSSSLDSPTAESWSTCTCPPSADIQRNPKSRRWTPPWRAPRLTKGVEAARKDAHRQALEDMVWAMLTSKEFLFNH